MKREHWLISKMVVTAVDIVSAANAEQDDEKQLSINDIDCIVEEIKLRCSMGQLENLQALLNRCFIHPDRYCIRNDCAYFSLGFVEKCKECLHNEKNKGEKFEHFEDVDDVEV